MKSRMPELGTYGSVGDIPSNRCFYPTISLFRQWKDVSRKPGKENGMVDLLHMAMNW